jgi:hypothetical protein
MLGAKTFTFDFKGNSGFMLELGGGANINDENGWVMGGITGIGYAGNTYKFPELDEIKVKSSTVTIPLKTYAKYGMLGFSLGYLLAFTNVNVDLSEVKGISNAYKEEIEKEAKQEGAGSTVSFGIMVFPTKNISINFDVIGSGGGAVGLAYYFGINENDKEIAYNADIPLEEWQKDFRKQESFKPAYTISEKMAMEDADSCWLRQIEKTTVIEDKKTYSISACIELKDGQSNCIDLNNIWEFKDASFQELKQFQLKKKGIYWKDPSYHILYNEFFPNENKCEES